MSAMFESFHHGWTRRQFLVSAPVVGAAHMLSFPNTAVSEPAMETTRVRLSRALVSCFGPQYLAEEFLRLEGFSQIEYPQRRPGSRLPELVGSGEVDFSMETAPNLLRGLDTGEALLLLAGIHAGCYELFAHESVKSVRDLRGKPIAVVALEWADHVYLSMILAYVGVDPRSEIEWIATGGHPGCMQAFVDRRVVAFLAFPPQPQDLRTSRLGHVLIDTGHDRPWSQYFCCMLAGNRDFVRRHPIATKRVLRAILKSAEICAQDPERAVRYLVSKGYESRYEVTLDVVKSLSYQRWRDFDPADTVRFNALRMYELGMIKSSPQKLLAQATDWQFLTELKKELKA